LQLHEEWVPIPFYSRRTLGGGLLLQIKFSSLNLAITKDIPVSFQLSLRSGPDRTANNFDHLVKSAFQTLSSSTITALFDVVLFRESLKIRDFGLPLRFGSHL
jgi:hypothetical protein